MKPTAFGMILGLGLPKAQPLWRACEALGVIHWGLGMKGLLCALCLLALHLQYRLWVGSDSIAEWVRLEREMVKQQAANQGMIERNRLLAAEVAVLKHGTQGIEARAREQMGMIKEGETFFMIVEPSH